MAKYTNGTIMCTMPLFSLIFFNGYLRYFKKAPHKTELE